MVGDGQQVSVRALTRMPGVADGEVRHLLWGPVLAVLVDAGRYELLEADPLRDALTRQPDVSVDEAGGSSPGGGPGGEGRRVRTGRAVGEPAAQDRPRTGRSR